MSCPLYAARIDADNALLQTVWNTEFPVLHLATSGKTIFAMYESVCKLQVYPLSAHLKLTVHIIEMHSTELSLTTLHQADIAVGSLKGKGYVQMEWNGIIYVSNGILKDIDQYTCTLFKLYQPVRAFPLLCLSISTSTHLSIWLLIRWTCSILSIWITPMADVAKVERDTRLLYKCRGSLKLPSGYRS